MATGPYGVMAASSFARGRVVLRGKSLGSMDIYPRPVRRLRGLLAAAALFVAAGCVNPNAIGVQDSGSIFGRVVDATNQQPIVNAIVSVNSLLTQKTGAGGAFNIGRVPVGTQSLTVYANG